MTRMQRRRARQRARRRRVVKLSACVTLLGAVVMMAAATTPGEGMAVDVEEPVLIATELVVASELEELEDPQENEKIELALVEQGYFRDDVPLTYDEQDYLHTACRESGIPYALALAVIERETGFRNVLGDDGASAGYMQVQKRWHMDRMERLGVEDLSHPFGNFRVGCDFLAELLEKYQVEEALTAYNSGSPGASAYSRGVMDNYDRWKELVGDDVSGIKS